MKNILVNCALPYANGPIHIGHILEHIQADIWVRYNKLLGNNVYFLCSDDSHGTPIFLKSKMLKISPEKMIFSVYNEHKNIFNKFNISHDFYYLTHSKENYIFCLFFLRKLKKNGLLYKKNIFQYYDIKEKMFLPDRLVKGKCPFCFSIDQYGDNCNICGKIYDSNNLINPISLLSFNKPILFNTEHLFFNLSFFKNILKDWVLFSKINYLIKDQLLFWLKNDFNDWNISRDKPYFGFKIPDKYIKNKYFYVWLDAILCYLSSFYFFCRKKKIFVFNDYWKVNSSYDVYNFLGKDILYFHGLIWPVILHIFNYRKPTGLIVHGHVLFDGYKMSKSKNNFITVDKWLNYFDSDSLRYYFATKLSYKYDDINFCISDFINKINSDIVNNFVNIPSRISKFIEIKYNGILSNKLYDYYFYLFFVKKSDKISNLFLKFDYCKALIEINKLIFIVNKYINDYKPWYIYNIEKANKKLQLHEFCSTIINIFRVISIYLSPVIPDISLKIEKYLNTKLTWSSLNKPLLNHKISKYKNLYIKIKNINNLI